MTYFLVMATESNQEDATLEAYRINGDQVISFRDLGSYRVCYVYNGQYQVIMTPICEIKLPGLTLYASGIAEELEARAR